MIPCTGCGQPFVPAQPHHYLCRACLKAEQANPDKHRPGEYRTIKFIVSKGVSELWKRAVSRACYEGCKAFPSPDDIITAIALATINEPLYQPDNGIGPADWHEAVHTGLVKCAECGSRNRQDLEFHHTVARSQGQAGRESVQVPLCWRCHSAIQSRWREWLAQHPEYQTTTENGQP